MFLIDYLTGQNTILTNINKKNSGNHYVCSVNFDRSGEALALGTSDRKVQIFDVEKGMQIRNMSGSGARVSCLSWNRSILAPYLLSAAGADSIIVNHDIRMRNSMIGYLSKHCNEVITLAWSTNSSYEQMRQSDPSSVYLSSTSMGADLAVYKLNDMTYGHNHLECPPFHFDLEIFSSPINALAWSPS